MGDWFRTPKQKFYAAFFLIMTLLTGALMFMSLGDGTKVWSKEYSEQEFESEEARAESVGEFELDSREVCMVKVEGLTLDQSWLWVKVLVLDEKDRPVHDYKFDLSRYHGVEGGESWSEGDQDDYKAFILPKGKYKVLVYGEDETPGVAGGGGLGAPLFSTGYTTIDRNERIRVTVTKDVMLTRYFLALFIIFLSLFVIYVVLRSEKSKTEIPVYYDHGGGGGGYVDPYAGMAPQDQGYAPQNVEPIEMSEGGAYDLTNQANAEGYNPDDPKNQG